MTVATCLKGIDNLARTSGAGAQPQCRHRRGRRARLSSSRRCLPPPRAPAGRSAGGHPRTPPTDGDAAAAAAAAAEAARFGCGLTMDAVKRAMLARSLPDMLAGEAGAS